MSPIVEDLQKHPLYYSFLGVTRSVSGFPIEHPLDVFKTKAQARASLSFFPIISQVIKESGLKGMYVGAVPSLSREVIKHSYRWPLTAWVHQVYESILPKSMGNRDFTSKILTSISIAGVETFVVTPVERLKVWKITADKSNSYHTFHRDLLSQQGIKALFWGLEAVFLKQISSWTTFMAANHFYKMRAREIDPANQYPITRMLLINESIALTVSAVVLPFDNLKTQMQKFQATEKQKITQTALKILRQSGVKGFYAGFLFRFVQYSLDAALSGTILDVIMDKKPMV